ncbi:MAG: outer membrane beta-barrel protein [Pseudomonadota bacterium]
MRNKFSALLTAFILVLPLGSHAEAFVGGGIGVAQLKVDSGELIVASKDEKDIGYKIVGGYKFSRYLSVEGGYVSLGKVKNTYSVGGNDVTLDMKSHGLYAAVKGSLPFSEEFSMFAKLGAIKNRSSATVSGSGLTIDATGSKISPMIGFGMDYDFGRSWNWVFSLEYDYFGKVAEDVKAGLWTVNLLYNF